MNVLMVVGGFAEGALFDVEMIDLSKKQRNCAKPSDYPLAAYGSTGAYIDGKVVLCGGYEYKKSCAQYNEENGTWTTVSFELNLARRSAVGTILDGKWWISGGSIEDPIEPEKITDETEMFDQDNKTFVNYRPLPLPRENHNLVTFRATQAMLLGGQYEIDETYIFDITNETWSDGPPMQTARDRCQAGLIKYGNGTKAIVAAGGYQSGLSGLPND